ncbi:MAG TPA: class I SAM-dependent methyltransferase [Vicinamibacterales bacterium]|nr:class I SAM-dependent methyltransferase [Vicinamibacterales bacterium]
MVVPMPPFVPPYGLLAPAYDDLIGRKFFDRIRRIFEHLIARHRIGFSSAADLGCGTGLFARYLNSLWRVPVFGVDLSPAMLRVAAANCRDTGVTLLHQDIRRLRLPRQVDLITANFDTLNHLVNDGELPALFRRVHDQLRPGGHFIFDFITPCDPLGKSAVRYVQASNGCKRVTQKIRWLPDRRMLLFEVRFREPSRDGDYLALHRERAYGPGDVARWLMEAGLQLRSVLDAATMRPAVTCPPRIIVVAQRPGSTRRQSCAAREMGDSRSGDISLDPLTPRFARGV